MRLEYLLEHRLIPTGAKLVDMSSLNCVEISKVSGDSFEYPEGAVVVVDGATWVAKGRTRAGDVPYFSGVDDDSPSFGLCSRKRFHIKDVETDKDGKLVVIPGKVFALEDMTERKVNKQLKEELNMANEINGKNDLISALNDTGIEPAATAPAYSTEFTDAPTPDAAAAEKKEKKEHKMSAADQLSQKIIAMGSKTKLPNTDRLRMFMRKHSRHLGFVTANDDQLLISVKKIKKLNTDGSPVVKDEEAAKAKAAEYKRNNKTLPISLCATMDTLVPKQKAPGKLLGSVVTVPKGGIAVPYSAFRMDDGSGFVKFEEDATAVTMLMPMEEYYAFMHAWMNDMIKEDPRTYGENAAELTVRYRAVNAKSSQDAPVSQFTQVARPVLAVSVKRSVVMPGAYMPINVFRTMPYVSIKSRDDIDRANNSLLGDYVRGKNALKEIASPETISAGLSDKYGNLSVEFQKVVRLELRDGEPVVTSPWFTTNGTPEPLNVPTYYNKDLLVTDLQIPVKEVALTKKGDSARWSLQKISAIGKDLSEQDREYSSLQNPKFKAFRDAAGEAVSEDALKSLSARSSSKGGSAKYVSSSAIDQLLFGDVQSAMLDKIDVATVSQKLSDRFEQFL